MITPQELRLGITLYDSLRKVEVIISKKHLREFLIDEKTFFERYKAISLSEDVLLERGFEKEGYQDIYVSFTKDEIRLWHYVKKETFLLDGIKYLNVYIKFLHQLENLIIDLTQESLIKK